KKLLIEFPEDIREALSLNDWITIRRTWNKLKLYEKGIHGYMFKIMKLTESLLNTGFAKRFNDTTKSVDLEIFFKHIRAVTNRIIRTRKVNNIANSLDKAVETKCYERVRAIIDQITLTWIILRLNLAFEQGMGREKGSPIKDYRIAISEYFDKKISNNNQRMIPGEFGTKIQFGKSIKILTQCPSCKRKTKYVSIENYENSKYDAEKEKILHLHKGECQECQYSSEAERAFHESQYASYEYERWEEEQLMLWEKGAFAYFFKNRPADLRAWLSESPYDLKEILGIHLYMLDDIFADLSHPERMTVWGLKCKNCNESMFKLTYSKESVHFRCLTPSCEQELLLPIDEKLSIVSTFERYMCPKCKKDVFEFTLGFEYVREGDEDLTEKDYSKIHVASYCMKCRCIEIICCTKEIKR
ncbi:MAG: hypothetical protein ACFFAO_21060, partial [Candidatus Hermodarchaeota archaeon]